MRNKLKFRHDIFLILAFAGILGLLISHNPADWQWYSLADLIGGINVLIFFFASVGCSLAYRFQKEGLSKIFAVIGYGVSILSSIFIMVVYENITLLQILSFLFGIPIDILLLWLHFKKDSWR